MRLALTAVIVAGCSTQVIAPPPGTATVRLFNRDGVPLASWPVIFHGADGTQLRVVETTPEGIARGPMEPDGMVTYRSPFPTNELVTRGGVQPGDLVVDGLPPTPPEPLPPVPIVVRTANTPEAAGLWEVQIVCGGRIFSGRSTPIGEITVEIPQGCTADPTDVGAPYLLATATDERYEVIAYAVFPSIALAPNARLDITEWRTDFVDSPVRISGLDPDLARYSIDAQAFVGDALIAWYRRGGNGPTATVSSTIQVPAGIPGLSRYELDALFETGELIVERRVPDGTPLFVGPADLLPRITSMSLNRDDSDPDRPTITFTTERPLDDDARIETVLVGTDVSWRLVNMQGPTVQLPELGAQVFPVLPYLSIPDLVLRRIAATTTYDDEVRTTAMPYAQ